MKLNIYDTAGQERFGDIGNIFYRNAVGALLVFDVTNRESFENIPTWLERLKENAGEGIVIMLIGNKSDLNEDRVIEYNEAAQFAEKNQMGYMETSAKTNEHDCVGKSFNLLIDSKLTSIF